MIPTAISDSSNKKKVTLNTKRDFFFFLPKKQGSVFFLSASFYGRMVTSRLCGSRQSLLGATAAALQQYNKRDKQDKRRIPLPVIFFLLLPQRTLPPLKERRRKKKENHSIIIATQFINRPADLSRTGVSLFVNAYLLLFFFVPLDNKMEVIHLVLRNEPVAYIPHTHTNFEINHTNG